MTDKRKKPEAPRPSTDAGDPTADEGVRLNKLLADCGIASRRRADELIAEGRVMVDGAIVTELGLKVDPGRQRVEYDGVVLDPHREPRRYYLLNKPAGVICTNERREARPRAVDLITDRDKGRIYSVGRLDEETTGLVILTNDGEFANRIMHPRYGVPKTYLVKLGKRIDEADVQKIREGVHLAEGRTSGARVLVKRRTEQQSTLWVTLYEGKNREVRRVFARLGYPVVALRRIRIGSLTDRGLKIGRWRPLTRAEVRELVDPGEAPAGRPRRSGARGRRPLPARRHGGGGGQGAGRGGGRGPGPGRGGSRGRVR